MNTPSLNPRRICLLGATGSIGRATLHALLARGYDVTCFIRRNKQPTDLQGAASRVVDVTTSESVIADGFRGESFDAVVSCMASRTGVPKDAWAIDHQAHLNVLYAAKTAGVKQFVLLSAICVQKPLLAFQHAKLAFEADLVNSGLIYSIVRPTAFFKSLSGQIERVRAGKPFLVFGNGALTACKPISDADLGNYLVGCLDDPTRFNRILPIGGPGPAITPQAQGEFLFARLGRPAKFKRVPVALLSTIIAVLGTVAKLVPSMQEKAELAKIGRYYATESMLVWNPDTGRYDEAATPSAGQDTLFDYYDTILSGISTVERGEHAVF